MPIAPETLAYNRAQTKADAEICSVLAKAIAAGLPQAENKVWHGHPVWFLEGNPIVGYSKLKGCVRLLFWSGQSFEEEGLTNEGSFKAAEARYETRADIDEAALRRWLEKSKSIQWDYLNIRKRRGTLVRIATTVRAPTKKK